MSLSLRGAYTHRVDPSAEQSKQQSTANLDEAINMHVKTCPKHAANEETRRRSKVRLERLDLARTLGSPWIHPSLPTFLSFPPSLPSSLPPSPFLPPPSPLCPPHLVHQQILSAQPSKSVPNQPLSNLGSLAWARGTPVKVGPITRMRCVVAGWIPTQTRCLWGNRGLECCLDLRWHEERMVAFESVITTALGLSYRRGSLSLRRSQPGIITCCLGLALKPAGGGRGRVEMNKVNFTLTIIVAK